VVLLLDGDRREVDRDLRLDVGVLERDGDELVGELRAEFAAAGEFDLLRSLRSPVEFDDPILCQLFFFLLALPDDQDFAARDVAKQ
jgi:hypothetical protein